MHESKCVFRTSPTTKYPFNISVCSLFSVRPRRNSTSRFTRSMRRPVDMIKENDRFISMNLTALSETCQSPSFIKLVRISHERRPNSDGHLVITYSYNSSACLAFQCSIYGSQTHSAKTRDSQERNNQSNCTYQGAQPWHFLHSPAAQSVEKIKRLYATQLSPARNAQHRPGTHNTTLDTFTSLFFTATPSPQFLRTRPGRPLC
jgi:hypothetical protein